MLQGAIMQFLIETLNVRRHVDTGYIWHTKHAWPLSISLFLKHTHLFTDLMNIARVMCRSQSVYQTNDRDIVYITLAFLTRCLVLDICFPV